MSIGVVVTIKWYFKTKIREFKQTLRSTVGRSARLAGYLLHQGVAGVCY